MNCGIYLIQNVINQKIYIGSSRNLKKRKYEHFRLLKVGTHRNPHLQNAYNYYSKEAFHWEILEYCEVEILIKRESWWMDLLDSRNSQKGYNLWTAESHKMSEETKAKISASLKGIKRTEETKIKLSDFRKGKPALNKGIPMSEEQKKKISESMKGNQCAKGSKRSDEFKQRVSITSKGRIPWNKGRKNNVNSSSSCQE